MSHTCLKTFEGHSHSVLKVWFISSGLQVVSASSDGLLKVWNLRSSECQVTLDKHLDKVWALAVADDGKRLASGGADSVVHFWADRTEAEAEKATQIQERAVLNLQKLENSLRAKRYRKAVRLSLDLDQPYRTRSILQTILEEEGDAAEFHRIIAGLSRLHTQKLLRFARYVPVRSGVLARM